MYSHSSSVFGCLDVWRSDGRQSMMSDVVTDVISIKNICSINYALVVNIPTNREKFNGVEVDGITVCWMMVWSGYERMNCFFINSTNNDHDWERVAWDDAIQSIIEFLDMKFCSFWGNLIVALCHIIQILLYPWYEYSKNLYFFHIKYIPCRTSLTFSLHNPPLSSFIISIKNVIPR